MFAKVFKFNPNHGKDGRFTSAPGKSNDDDLVSMGDSWMGGNGQAAKVFRIPPPPKGFNMKKGNTMKQTDGWAGDLGLAQKKDRLQKAESQPVAKSEPPKKSETKATEGWGGMLGV